ncbi:MAG: histidinol-phosphate aminotransferase family protein [Thaumarchaeota archaeon]|nr:histidinol-phosphate aminotransferase family protein [Nitrososphaerota archaeon]
MEEWTKRLRMFSDRGLYEGGIGIQEASRITGMNTEDMIPLQSNENLFVEREFISGLLKRAIDRVDPRLYPHGDTDYLKESIGRYLGLNTSSVFLGAGTDQIIDLLTLVFKKNGGVGIVEPTFSMYKVRSTLNRVRAVSFPYHEDFSLPVEMILKGGTDMLFLCSPNNPTGNSIGEEELKRLLDSFPGLLVIDETYAEISNESLIKYLKRYDNLAIMRTFSKSFALAGMRIGYITGPPDLIKALNSVQLTFPISSLSLALAAEALEHLDYFKDKWNQALETMSWFLGELDEGIKRTPTDTFFLTISTQTSTEKLFIELLKNGYITRKLNPFMKFKNPLRFSMAPRPLIDSLPSLINKKRV